MNKKFNVALAFALGFCALETQAVLPIGSTAPNFTMKDTKGVTHDLYSYLNKGTSVIMDVFTTHCGPCYGYVLTGAMDGFYKKYGPGGDKSAMVLMIEADGETDDACLHGDKKNCSLGPDGTVLDWTNIGITYPMIDAPPELAPALDKNYLLYLTYPSVFLICPDKKVAAEGKLTTEQYKAAMDAKCKPVTGIKAGIDSHLSVYPNISSGSVFVGVSAEGPLAVKMGVYDAAGKAVLAKAAGVSGSREFKFDLSAQPDGLYYVRVKTANGLITRKILLSK